MNSVLRDPSLAHNLVPAFTWDELEARLTILASSPTKKAMVSALVSAVRKQSWALPSIQVLDEILSLAWVLNDETFQPAPAEDSPDETL